jgi:tetratricopeptide (TPR) repeat protein
MMRQMPQVLLLLFIGLLCYGGTFSVPFEFDDFSAIVVNSDVTGSKSLLQLLLHGGARRVVNLTFALNYRLHGLQLFGYHLVNLLIHLATTLTLYFLITTLLKSLYTNSSVFEADELAPHTSANGSVYIAFTAALLFVCHPLQTQAVTYVVQRYTSLVALFYLLTVLAYVKGRLHGGQVGTVQLSRCCFVFAGVSAVLALLSKQSVYSLPLMILLLEVTLFQGRAIKRHLRILSIVGVVLLALLLALVYSGTSSDWLLFDLRHNLAEDLHFSRSTYAITQLRVVATYLRLYFLPLGQNLDYDYPLFTSLANGEIIAAAVLHIVLVTIAVLLYRVSLQPDNRFTVQQRLIALGIGWFYVALSVESSFIPITDVIMEHRMYLPSAGLCLAVTALVDLLRLRFAIAWKTVWSIVVVVCVALSLLTITRNRVWRDELTLWQDVAAKSPHKARVLANLGWAYLNRDEYEMATRLLVTAISQDQRTANHTWIMLNSALAGLRWHQDKVQTDTAYLNVAGDVDLRFYSQFNSVKFNNMGVACEFINHPEEALLWYQRAVVENTRNERAWYNLGQIATQLGNSTVRSEAITTLEGLKPEWAALQGR